MTNFLPNQPAPYSHTITHYFKDRSQCKAKIIIQLQQLIRFQLTIELNASIPT